MPLGTVLKAEPWPRRYFRWNENLGTVCSFNRLPIYMLTLQGFFHTLRVSSKARCFIGKMEVVKSVIFFPIQLFWVMEAFSNGINIDF